MLRALKGVRVGVRDREKAIMMRIKSKRIKVQKNALFIRTKHNVRIFGVIPFIKRQNDT